MLTRANISPGLRLPLDERFTSLMRTPLGGLMARRWFDTATLAFLRRVYFPLSRLWAAAEAAGNDPDAFAAAVPMDPREFDRDRVARTLAHLTELRATAALADHDWHETFFAPRPLPADRRVAAELRRAATSHAYMAGRGLFLRQRPRAPRVRWDIQSPDAVAAALAPYGGDPAAFFALPGTLPEIARSHPVTGPLGPEYWVRFTSPVLGDTAWARVFEPAPLKDGVTNPPTLILGHGIGVEFDHWQRGADEATAWVRRGLRVIRPEAPWHGRRRPRGQYGGEAMLARAPLAGFELFRAQTVEAGVLTGWARSLGNAPVTIGGMSLSALAAQLAASAARDWPAANRPDALFAVTHSDDLAEVTFDGSLADAFGVTERLTAAGWTRERLACHTAIATPADTLAMPPERIVSVLATHDTVTPYASGRALVDRWGVPPENLFIRPRGHFSTALGLLYDHAPMDRFTEVLRMMKNDKK